jgi:hypothetical protein
MITSQKLIPIPACNWNRTRMGPVGHKMAVQGKPEFVRNEVKLQAVKQSVIVVGDGIKNGGESTRKYMTGLLEIAPAR